MCFVRSKEKSLRAAAARLYCFQNGIFDLEAIATSLLPTADSAQPHGAVPKSSESSYYEGYRTIISAPLLYIGCNCYETGTPYMSMPLPHDTFHYSDQSFNTPTHIPTGPYLPDYVESASNPAVHHHQQQLRVNTLELSLYDSSASASSSIPSSFLHTPHMQTQWDRQLAIFSPSATTDFQQTSSSLSPDKDHSPPISPSTPHSPGLCGGTFGEPVPLSLEIDEEEPEIMSHIKQWKEVSNIASIATGTRLFVPQKIYQPYTEADRLRYIRNADLKPPIYFYSKNPYECAVSLEDAMKARLKNLIDKEEQMFIGCGPSVSIRIQWPGYRSWSKQIPTNDFKTPRGPITKGKLAKNIANCVRGFIEAAEKQRMEAESDRRWRVGRHHIKVEDLMLVSLHHVSKGSWQPQLRLRRTSPEFSAHRPWGTVASSSNS